MAEIGDFGSVLERNSSREPRLRSCCIVLASTTSVITRSPMTRICFSPPCPTCAAGDGLEVEIESSARMSTTGPGGYSSALALPLPLTSAVLARAASKYRRTAFAHPGFLTECSSTGTPRCLETDSALRGIPASAGYRERTSQKCSLAEARHRHAFQRSWRQRERSPGQMRVRELARLPARLEFSRTSLKQSGGSVLAARAQHCLLLALSAVVCS